MRPSERLVEALPSLQQGSTCPDAGAKEGVLLLLPQQHLLSTSSTLGPTGSSLNTLKPGQIKPLSSWNLQSSAVNTNSSKQNHCSERTQGKFMVPEKLTLTGHGGFPLSLGECRNTVLSVKISEFRHFTGSVTSTLMDTVEELPATFTRKG